MTLYQQYVLPHVIHMGCGAESCRQQRAQVVPEAAGRVLEVGFGTGLNLPHYDPMRVREVLALDPSEAMWKRATGAVTRAPFPVAFVHASGEDVPLDDQSVDTVVVTYTLCSIPDVPRALGEVRRVLKPGGRVLFCEHGAAPDPGTLRWQKRLNPLWIRLGGGCRLDRRPDELLRAGGFKLRTLSSGYVPGWKVDSFVYRGTAVPSGDPE